MRVAVVDDDSGCRRAMARLLRVAGFDSVTYASAEECLEGIDREGADCLVVDVHLGGMSGFDLPGLLAQRGAARPVVFLTAHENPEYLARARDAGSAILAKPVASGDLLDAVRKALVGRQPEPPGSVPPADAGS